MNTHITEKVVRKLRNIMLVVGGLSLSLLALPSADAEPLSTDNYRLDPNVSNSFGGLVSSDSYELLDSGGEAVIGLGDSPSYKLSQGYASQLEQSIELSVVPEGLHVYFPLNTGTGIQAYDMSANSNHGVLEGSPEWAGGHVGRGALEFDGQNDWVSFSGLPAPGNSLVDGTYSAWIRTSNDEGTRVIVGDFNDDNNLNMRYIGTEDGYLHMGQRASGESKEWTISDAFVADGDWYHVAAVMSSEERILYLNGEEVARSTENLTAPTTSPDNAAIGRADLASPSANFDGEIDEVKVYSRSLNKDEVLDDYLASSQGAPSAFTLPRLEPGQSQSVGGDAVIRTDAGGYSIAIEQDGDLRTNQGDTIPAIESSISFPSTWNEGTTTGFGFSVLDGVQRDGKWGSDPDFEYAAVPSNSTTFHSRDGLSGGEKEITELEFRAEVDTTQAGGVYRNRLGFTATLKP